MKRIILSSLVALILLVGFVPVANADMAMEGSGQYKGVYSYTRLFLWKKSGFKLPMKL
jgi:hypothetical protein